MELDSVWIVVEPTHSANATEQQLQVVLRELVRQDVFEALREQRLTDVDDSLCCQAEAQNRGEPPRPDDSASRPSLEPTDSGTEVSEKLSPNPVRKG